MFSATSRFGKRAYDWNTIPTLRFSIGTSVTSSSPKRTRPPGSGFSSPAMMRSVVVLPQPDGPSSTTVSPASIERSSGSSAFVPSSNVLPQRCSRMRTPCALSLMTWLPCAIRYWSCRRSRYRDDFSRAPPRLGKELYRDQQRHDHDEEDRGVRAADLEAHGRIAVGKPDGDRLVERRVQHPGDVELANRQGDDHQSAGDDA